LCIVDLVVAYFPAENQTLVRVAEYVTSLKARAAEANTQDEGNNASKKRKLATADGQTLPELGGNLIFSIPDISFSIPVRKKLKLEGVNGGIRGLDASGNMEVTMAWSAIGTCDFINCTMFYLISSTDHVFCLPVPERAKPQHNFVVIPKAEVSGIDSVVWTALEINPKAPNPQQGPEAMAKNLDAQLAKFAKKVVWPSDDEFVSALGSVKGSKSYGTRAHRGSKEGYLFFLSPGVLWAFKKPILFLPFHNITSISYTSVLQRTFNLVIVARETSSDEETEIEFSMLDQGDFAAIDDYIKRHGLNDTSLAEKRRAKVYNVNTPKEKGVKAGADAPAEVTNGTNAKSEENESEIQKAEKLLQDEEDDEEEDYVDEGSEEDSSGDEGYEDGYQEEYEYAEGDGGEEEEGFEEEEEYDEEAGGDEDEE
jgi:Histone chaperone Rttp106-like